MTQQTDTVSIELEYPFTTYRQEIDASHARLRIQLDKSRKKASICLFGKLKKFNSDTQKIDYGDIGRIAEINVPSQLIQDMLNAYFKSSRREEEFRIAIHEGRLRELIRGKWKPKTVIHEVK